MHIGGTDLGAIVKAARLNKGLKQETVAERVGVGPRHIMAIENEGSYPSYEVLYKLIRELHIPADSIFYPENGGSNSRLEQLVHLLKRCGDKEIRVVTALAEALLAEAGE